MTLTEIHQAFLATVDPDRRVVPEVVMRPWGWSLRFDWRFYYPKAKACFQLPEDHPSLHVARFSWDDRAARAGEGVRAFGEVWSEEAVGFVPVCGRTYDEALAELARKLNVKETL